MNVRGKECRLVLKSKSLTSNIFFVYCSVPTTQPRPKTSSTFGAVSGNMETPYCLLWPVLRFAK